MSLVTDELPIGWVETTLTAIGKWQTGGTPSRKKEAYFNGPIPWVKSGDLRDGIVASTDETITDEGLKNSAAKVLPKGSVCIALYGATIGKAGILGIDAATNQACASCTVDSRVIENRFLFHYLISQRKQFVAAGQGGAQPNLTNEIVRNWPLLLPPLSEQRRIVAKTEALQARSRKAREALEAIPPLLEQFRQSVLAAAFRGDLTADWREQHPNVEPATVLLDRIRADRRYHWEQAELARYKAKGKVPKDGSWKERYVEPEPVDDADLPKLPQGWRWANVGQLATKVVDGVHKKPNYVEDGVPFVTVKNLTAGPGISFAELKYITRADHSEFIKRANPERGDVLVTKDGTLGVVQMIETDVEFSIFVSVALIKPVLKELASYISFALSSPQGRAAMKATGSGLQHIHLVDLRAARIPLPPAEEQQEIIRQVATRLQTLEKIASNVQRMTCDASILDQSILAKAFRGELVCQDPNDEPATVLLERIKAERVENANGKPSRSRRKRTSDAVAEKNASDDEDGPAASNGKPQPVPALRRPIDDYAADELMPYFRSALRAAADLTEVDFLRDIAQRLGFERLGPQVRAVLQGHLRAAIRRGIAERDGDFLRAATPTFQRYSDDQLLKTFTSVMRPGHEYDRDEVVRAIAKHLGYTQVTPAMRTRMKSIFNIAIRRHLLTRQGPRAIAR